MYKKLSVTFFVMLFLLATQFAWAQSLSNNDSKEEAKMTGEKVELPYQTIYLEGSDDLLFDNGPLVTLPAGGCAGGDASILDGTLGHTLYGWGHQQNLGNYMADDFTSTASWNIDSLKFFAYQTGATAVTITGVYVQIWSGAPNAGGTIVWGDLTTNRLQSATLSNIYRAQSTTPTDCNRRIQTIVATAGVNLPAGQYWVQWGMTGSLASGPWCPPVTISGQAITGDALQNVAGVWAAALNGTSPNGAPFIVYGTSGAPCPVGPATNPNPPSGTTGVPINAPGTATWVNGVLTSQVEVFFGPAGNMVSVYSGAPITSLAIPAPLQYNTTYQWKVVCSNGTCNGSPVETWSFTTEQNPNVLFEDQFPDFSKWTVIGPLGLTNWSSAAGANAGGTTPELRLSWTPSFNGESRIRSVVIPAPNSVECTFTFKWFFDWFANPSGTIGLAATYDGGATTIPLWSVVDPTGNAGPETVSVLFTTPATEVANLQFELYFIGNSFNNDNIYWDDMLLTFVIPVELTSFAAVTDNRNVTLNWSTATELNNSGFQIERSSGSEFQSVGFIAGHGTTTEIQNYSFVDQNVVAGKYSYRLKQIDFNGAFEYSDVVEVEVLGVKEFTLGQNYPNPFNPSTTINFSLAVDSKVSLRIFDVLGQEVATLVNGQLAAGSQRVSFDASSLNSGVYFYRIDADGIDGQKFSSTRKMILTK